MAPRQTATAEKKATQAQPQEAPTGNLPATQQQNGKQPPLIVQFRDYVQARMATLEDALPPTIPPKRFVSVVMTALQNKPKLLECTFASLWNACVRAAQDGLLPDGREGAIAPYGENKDGKRQAEIATWMPMLEGYRKKAFEAGQVATWEVNVVYEKDEFDYELGDNAFIRHKPYIGGEASGGIVGAYSRAKLANGEVVREVMSAYQIMQVKAKSKAGNGPWQDAAFFPEMCKKVVARRHYKQLPHSESMDAMIARDDAEHGLLDRDDTPPIARVERRQLSPQSVMDQYAGIGSGEVVDVDTGEVTEMRGSSNAAATADRIVDEGGAVVKDREDGGSNAKQVTDTAKTSGGSAKEGGGEAAAPAASSPSASNSNAGSATRGETSGARTEAGATSTAHAPASSTSASQALTADASNELLDDDGGDQVDGADRPWPPGTEPTDVNEYERYLRTKLAAMTKAADVAPWFNSPSEKELRVKCECAAKFKELQDIAIARRKELN